MDWWASNYCAAASPTHGEGNQLVDTTTTGAAFDPWLNCDDLDLGGLLPPTQTGGSASNQQQTANNQQFSHATRTQPQPPTHQSKLPPDNKTHIISIINNSASSQHNQQVQQQHHHHQQHIVQYQQQQRQTSDSFESHHHNGNRQSLIAHQRPNTTSSTAVSPLSSSLGSSPPNHQTASLLSPPHSSASPIFANYQDQKPTAYFIECFDPNRHPEHQQLYVANNQNATVAAAATAYYGLSSANTPPTAKSIIMTSGDTTQLAEPRTIAASTRTTNGGNSLLNAGTKLAGSRRPYNKRSARQVSTGAASAGCDDAGARKTPDRGGPKSRRCRYITEFALTGEEKRLLVKEGFPDFPTNCDARPLTKSEERILRKVRRKIRNKKSAQCSRQRKKEYVEELEMKYAEILAENNELRRLLAAAATTGRSTGQLQQKPASDNCLADGGGSTSGESSTDQISWVDLVPQQQRQQEQAVNQESRAIVYSCPGSKLAHAPARQF